MILWVFYFFLKNFLFFLKSGCTIPFFAFWNTPRPLYCGLVRTETALFCGFWQRAKWDTPVFKQRTADCALIVKRTDNIKPAGDVFAREKNERAQNRIYIIMLHIIYITHLFSKYVVLIYIIIIIHLIHLNHLIYSK